MPPRVPLPARARVLVLAGTRPECIKLASVVEALRLQPELLTVLVASGQHPAMVARTFAHLGLEPQHSLAPVTPGSSRSHTVRHLRDQAGDCARALQATAVVVQGDTSTAYAGALAGRLAGIPVAHVEAGLRTATPLRPFPEEPFRRRIAGLAHWHFAPTGAAARNLHHEGIAPERVHCVGNTGIDALRRALEGADAATPAPSPDPPILTLTLHRRENYGRGLDHVAEAILTILQQHPALRVVCPVHPNPLVGARLRRLLGGRKRIDLVEPMDYRPFVRLLAASALVVTDSGGIQEEAPYLGVPVLVVREATERPEALAHGGVRLVPPLPTRIVQAANQALAAPRPAAVGFGPQAPFGDGRAGERIARVLADALVLAPEAAATLSASPAPR